MGVKLETTFSCAHQNGFALPSARSAGHPEWLPERQGRARIRARRRRREAAEGPMTAVVFHGRHGRLRHRSLARGLRGVRGGVV